MLFSMKTVKTATLLFLALSFISLPCPVALADTPDSRTTLQVEGMTCESCVQKVQTALLDLNGVNEARVSLEKKRAEVTYNPDLVSTSDMRTAIEQLGFRVTGEQRAGTDAKEGSCQKSPGGGCCH